MHSDWSLIVHQTTQASPRWVRTVISRNRCSGGGPARDTHLPLPASSDGR